MENSPRRNPSTSSNTKRQKDTKLVEMEEDKENISPTIIRREHRSFSSPRKSSRRVSSPSGLFRSFFKGIFTSDSPTSPRIKKSFSSPLCPSPPPSPSRFPSPKEEKEEEIEFAPFSTIPSAGLLKWLITDNLDANLDSQFFLSYRNFEITAEGILDTLTEIYNDFPSEEVSPSTTKMKRPTWHKKKIIKFVYNWLKHCPLQELIEQKENGTLLERVQQLLSTMESDGFTFDCRPAKVFLEKIRSQVTEEPQPSSQSSQTKILTPVTAKLTRLSSAKSITMSKPSQLHFTRFSPQRVAKAMHSLECQMFGRIQASEFHHLGWASEDRRKKSPNLVAMIDRFNSVSFWVATEIVTASTTKKQTNLLKRFISIAQECRVMHSFNTVMEILAGLNNVSVMRLTRVWEALPEKYKQSLAELEKLLSSCKNYRVYRQELSTLRSCKVPGGVLPYLGVYLRDLTFIEDGNPSRTEDGKINFDKMQMVGSILSQVQYYQSQYQDTEEDLALYNFFSNLVVMDEETLYRCSKMGLSPQNSLTVVV